MAPRMHRQSRRQFIRETLAGSGSLGVAAGLPADEVALQRLRGQLKGRLILPTDAEYDAARRVNFWNPETEKRPAVIARCARVDDVRYAVEFARRHGLETAVRGGGHSHMAMSTSNGMVIDLAGMKQVSIEAAKRTARMDAGVLSGEAMRAAGVHGLAPIAGQCPGVGMAGVTLGGGLGWLSGLYGACCDNLISARLVAADGRIVEVDAERNAELLWAMQGAGANFGVAVSMEYRLYPVGPVLSGDIFYPVGAAREVLRFFRDFMAEAPDGFQATLNLTPGERGVFLSLCHAGAEAEGARLLTGSAEGCHSVEGYRAARQEFAELAGACDGRGSRCQLPFARRLSIARSCPMN
jgi:FAD/FMN-containing dehydrogenase